MTVSGPRHGILSSCEWLCTTISLPPSSRLQMPDGDGDPSAPAGPQQESELQVGFMRQQVALQSQAADDRRREVARLAGQLEAKQQDLLRLRNIEQQYHQSQLELTQAKAKEVEDGLALEQAAQVSLLPCTPKAPSSLFTSVPPANTSLPLPTF